MRKIIRAQIKAFTFFLARRMVRKHRPEIVAVTSQVAVFDEWNGKAFIVSDDSFRYSRDFRVALLILGVEREPRNNVVLFVTLFKSIFYYHRFIAFPEYVILHSAGFGENDLRRYKDLFGFTSSRVLSK